MVTISINKKDILKSIYFITAIIQKQTSGSMQGALSSKGDLMGGIFDRWINIVPESIVFNKIILPKVKNGQQSEIISDFYLYDPKTAGIAPDVIGIRTLKGTIPFAVFNERWKPIENMPQIEVKTFKKPQKMISLRNQDYDGKYLVIAESELRIDYLLPFFDASIFQDSIHSNLVMDDKTFIVSNSAGILQGIDIVNTNNDEIGKVTLLKVTTAESFMKSATFCEGTVSVQYINGIEKKTRFPAGSSEEISLSNFCSKTTIGLYSFSGKWYEGYTAENIPYYIKNSRGGTSNAFLYRTLDFFVDDINSISVIKKSNSSMYIKTSKNVRLNEHQLQANSIYKIDFAMLDRSSNNGVEYFMQKSLISHIKDYQEQLKNALEEIINGGI
jgi:hypothetical protein|nr:MAG TPA: hypothetical protein [Caudoviricetes sp.]